MDKISEEPINLPDNLQGRNLHEKVIPTVCNLENMLEKLIQVDGDDSKLEQWEKRSYKAYQIDNIKDKILNTPSGEWKDLIKEHIVNSDPSKLGANCIDIYLVAYVAENYGEGRQQFIQYVMEKDISDKENSAKAIWQVGRGDGEYLEVLNDDGTVKDWSFFKKWLRYKPEEKQINIIEQIQKLNELVETLNDENKKAVKETVEKLNKLSNKIEKQSLEIKKQCKDINKLSEKIRELKRDHEKSLWQKTRNFFSQ